LTQALQRAITMTASPTAVALQPSAGKHFNVYLDTTFGALGTTQLTDALTSDFAFAGLYNPFFSLNRANLGFSAHVDGKPTTTFKLLLPADAVAWAYFPTCKQVRRPSWTSKLRAMSSTTTRR